MINRISRPGAHKIIASRRWCTLIAPGGRLFSLSAFVLLLFVSPSPSGSAQSQFDTWDTDRGLPNNSIQDILQTRDGYLWLATADGLVRFDGAQFTIFNSGNTPGLRSNRFSVLLEDQGGVLWVGTEDGGLAKYEAGAFTSYTVADGLPSNWVRQIQHDPAPRGGLLVNTDAGIIRWPEKSLLPHAPHDGPLPTRSKYVDRGGIVWFHDYENLYRSKDGVETTYGRRDGLAGKNIMTVYQDREGSIWIATLNSGVQRFRDGSFRTYTAKDGLPQNYVQVFYEDRAGHLWLGTSGGGLVRLSYANDDGRYDDAPRDERVRVYTTAEGLSSNSIKSICEDAEGSLWVGTFGNGLNRLRRQLITIYSERDGLGSDNIYPILQDRAGNVWMGNWPSGLTVYSGGSFRHYTRQDGLPAGNLITALAEDNEGRLWIGGYDGVGWFRDGKFTPLPETLALNGGGVTAIYQDRSGGFWFGTDKAGLYRYRDGKLSHMTEQDGLPSESVHAIIGDREGNIWLGTYGGLVKFRGDGTTVYTTRDGLASNRVRTIYEDSEGVLWVGTYDGGLSRYKDGRFTSYTVRDGLFNSGAFQILEDGRGNLWLSCNLGIYRVSKRQLDDFAESKIHSITSVAYGKPDGMLNAECNGGTQPAGTRTRDGKLWFPTQGGVAVIDPEAVHFNSQPPPVVIESALVDREARDLRQAVQLEPGQTSLEIHYTGLSFIKPEQVRFRYTLEGVDDDWVEAGNRRVAYYSHLPPGEYVFRVSAANADGVWNTAGASLRVSIRPPFYRTTWFLLIISVSIVGAAALFYRWRVTRLEKEKAAQQAFSKQLIESQEQERKRIAVELHDGLGQSLVVIRNRALVGLDEPENHDRLVAQVEEISEAASHALSEVRGIARNLHPYQIDYLGLTTALRTMIESVGGASRIEIRADIDKIDGRLSKEGEINLYRIVQEGLNNVVKHSGATWAAVSLKVDGAYLDLLIEDDGRGFSPASVNQKAGLGLVGMGERARLLGAHYEIRSLAGKGTTVHLRMNLPETTNES